MNLNMQNFAEKDILDEALGTEKSTSSVYNTYANECVCQQLRNDMMQILNETHTIQADVFNIMQNKGMYQPAQAQQQKVTQAKQKFSSQAG